MMHSCTLIWTPIRKQAQRHLAAWCSLPEARLAPWPLSLPAGWHAWQKDQAWSLWSTALTLAPCCADLTEQTREDLYKLVYFEAEQSFQAGGPLQGLLFWRWNAVQNVDLGTTGVPGSSAQTVDTDSSTFQQVPLPPFGAALPSLFSAAAGAGVAVQSSMLACCSVVVKL